MAREVRSLDIPGLRMLGATDSVLEHVRELVNLRRLNLYWTQVGDAGVEELKRHLPELGVRR